MTSCGVSSFGIVCAQYDAHTAKMQQLCWWVSDLQRPAGCRRLAAILCFQTSTRGHDMVQWHLNCADGRRKQRGRELTSAIIWFKLRPIYGSSDRWWWCVTEPIKLPRTILCVPGHHQIITSPIGLHGRNHSFAKSSRVAGSPGHRRQKNRLEGYFSSACESTSRLQDAKVCFQLELRAKLCFQLSTAGCLLAPQIGANARDSLQTYASSRANLWVK